MLAWNENTDMCLMADAHEELFNYPMDHVISQKCIENHQYSRPSLVQ